MTSKSPSKCPFCKEPYQTKTIAGLLGNPITIRIECGCDGAREERERERATEEHGRLVQAWRKTGVPKRYDRVKPDEIGLQSLMQTGGYYLHGPKGRGKTHSACALLKAYIKKKGGWGGARFVSVPDFFGMMRGSSWGEDEERAYSTAAGASLLVLDDLGKGKPTEWAMERLFRLIDRRYNDMKPTIITSQYAPDQLADRLSAYDKETAEAIVSRIEEMCYPIAFDGEDYRKRPRFTAGVSYKCAILAIARREKEVPRKERKMEKYGIKVYVNGKPSIVETTNSREHARELAQIHAKNGYVASIVNM